MSVVVNELSKVCGIQKKVGFCRAEDWLPFHIDFKISTSDQKT